MAEVKNPDSLDADALKSQTIALNPTPEKGSAAEGVPLSSEPVPAVGPSFAFLGIVAGVSLVADVGTKAWAEIVLSSRESFERSIILVQDTLYFTLTYNQGGAWGLLRSSSDSVRRPFFFVVSLIAIAFIVSLYRKLTPEQRALKWGLPLVLGGALGNVSDRLVRPGVVDFIDYRADWVETMNGLIGKLSSSWNVTRIWPTFNVADILICVGVGLMAVDMLTSKKERTAAKEPTVKSDNPSLGEAKT